MKDKRGLLLAVILTAISLTMYGSHCKEINAKDKELIDKAFDKAGLANITDNTPEICSELFNKMENLDECYNKNSALGEYSDEEYHYYVFHIVSKIVDIYYEFYYGVCLNVNETTIQDYVNEDYLMLNSSIINTQISKRKKLYPTQNFTIASICILSVITGYVFFCIFIWVTPCKFARLEKNEALIKQQMDSKIPLPSTVINEKEDEGARIKQKQIFEQIINSFKINNLFKELITRPTRNYEKEIKLLLGLKAVCYIIVMFYTCAPILFKPPSTNPVFLIQSVKWLSLQFMYNGDVFFDIIISIEVFITIYPYLSPQKKLSLKEITIDIIGKITETYFCMLVIYLIFWKVLPIGSPLSNLFFSYERESCQAQMFPILGLFSNFTFGLYESFYPYCVYHFWFIHLSLQFFLFSIVCILLFKCRPTFFYLGFFLLSLYMFFFQLWSTSNHPTKLSFYDVLRRNPLGVQFSTQSKIYTRIMPLLIGIFMAVLFKTKEDNCIAPLQKSRCKSVILCLFGVSLFTFWFLIHYFTINDIYPSFFKAPIFLFFYNLFKRTAISISFFLFFIPLTSTNALFNLIYLLFNNALVDFFEKISVGMYLSGSIITRIIFYNDPTFFGKEYTMSTISLIMSLVVISILSILSSVVITALFKIPFIRIWLIVKHKLIKEK